MLGFGSAALVAISGFVWPLSGWMLLGLFAAMGLIQSASFAMVPQLNTEATSQALANGVMSQMGNLGNLIGTPIMFALLTSLGTYSIYGMLLFCFGSAVAVHAWLALRRSRSV
jgi:nitrate/nitrite transporter NarK